MYSKFPLINYNGLSLAEITRRLTISNSVKNRVGTYDLYLVKEGERIEDLAYRIYGDPNYNWVIMLMNDIIDPFYDWAMSSRELDAHVTTSYTNPAGIHHWELNGKVVTEQLGAVSITNFTYEDRLNEERRKIKLLRKAYIPVIEEEVSRLLNQ